MAERSGDWLGQARRDLAAARASLDAGLPEWACFASQQAAEKALKAVLERGGQVAFGHSLPDLLEAVTAIHPDARTLATRAIQLGRAYIPTRYPDAHPAGMPGDWYTREDGESLIAAAGAILEFCADRTASL